MTSREALEPLDRDLWVASRPLRLAIGDIGARMTVMRLAGGDLLLHSPVPCDAETRAGVDALGSVRWILGPSKVHHFYLGDWAAAYPEARLCGAPGLAEKRRDLRFARVVDDALAAEWPGVEVHLFQGAPHMNEVVLLHAPSRTLVLTALAFNVRRGSSGRARLFHRLVGATDRFGPHRLVKWLIRDRAAARRSVDAILGWDFDRVVVSHGEVLESGGRDRLAAAFAFLP